MKAAIGLAVLAFVAGLLPQFLPDPVGPIHSISEITQRSNTNTGLMNLSIWLAWAWALSALAASYFDRWRASWLLLTAPLALLWPLTANFLHMCGPFGGCILAYRFTAG